MYTQSNMERNFHIRIGMLTFNVGLNVLTYRD